MLQLHEPIFGASVHVHITSLSTTSVFHNKVRSIQVCLFFFKIFENRSWNSMHRTFQFQLRVICLHVVLLSCPISFRCINVTLQLNFIIKQYKIPHIVLNYGPVVICIFFFFFWKRCNPQNFVEICLIIWQFNQWKSNYKQLLRLFWFSFNTPQSFIYITAKKNRPCGKFFVWNLTKTLYSYIWSVISRKIWFPTYRNVH